MTAEIYEDIRRIGIDTRRRVRRSHRIQRTPVIGHSPQRICYRIGRPQSIRIGFIPLTIRLGKKRPHEVGRRVPVEISRQVANTHLFMAGMQIPWMRIARNLLQQTSI